MYIPGTDIHSSGLARNGASAPAGLLLSPLRLLP